MAQPSSSDAAMLDEYLAVALEAAKGAGALILEAFKKPKQIQEKSSAVDLVTETDKACENLIFSILKTRFPDHKFIGEESHQGSFDFSEAPTWMVDPVDGTTNFIHSFPMVCVSIGLWINKQPVVAVILNPVLGETFTAIKGRGALLNSSPINVSATRDLTRSSVLIEFGYDRTPLGVDEQLLRLRRLLLNGVQALRSCGSCAFNMTSVAVGRVDAYYEGKDEQFGPKCWDMAAGRLIVEEAGGITGDWRGGPLNIFSGRVMCVNSQVLADQLMPLVNVDVDRPLPLEPAQATINAASHGL